METRRITSMEQLPEAAAALKLGGLVAVPTETAVTLLFVTVATPSLSDAQPKSTGRD